MLFLDFASFFFLFLFFFIVFFDVSEMAERPLAL